jgi:hypothetical protein
MMPAMRRELLAVLAALSVGLGCGAEVDTPDPQDAYNPDEVIEQLGAIGYVDGSEPAPLTHGVVTWDRARAQDGLNLFTSGHGPVALLMDMDGRVLHEWRADFRTLFPAEEPAAPVPPRMGSWRHVQLLDDGSLIGVWEPHGIFKLDRDSRVVWSRANRAHHDFFVDEAGHIYGLSFDRNSLAGAGPNKLIEDFYFVLDADGNELERVSMAEALENANWRELREAFWKREEERDSHIKSDARTDPFHTNSIYRLSATEASWLGDPFREGDLLVSMCLLDTIAAIDPRTRTARWWQTGPFALQHHPRPMANGTIVLFNNHVTRTTSSVVEIEPASGKVVWEYSGSWARPLASQTLGTVEVLANGNLLIVESNQGRVIEVTPDREVVWEFQSPHRVSKRFVAVVSHMDRVPRSMWRAER